MLVLVRWPTAHVQAPAGDDDVDSDEEDDEDDVLRQLGSSDDDAEGLDDDEADGEDEEDDERHRCVCHFPVLGAPARGSLSPGCPAQPRRVATSAPRCTRRAMLRDVAGDEVLAGGAKGQARVRQVVLSEPYPEAEFTLPAGAASTGESRNTALPSGPSACSCALARAGLRVKRGVARCVQWRGLSSGSLLKDECQIEDQRLANGCALCLGLLTDPSRGPPGA